MAGVTTYERGAGVHVAERVRPEPGSPEEAELERLAEDPASPWRRVPDPDPEPAPKPPAKTAAKTTTKPGGTRGED